MLHTLRKVMQGVEKTHPGMGTTVAMATVALRAGKMVLLVSPTGCGKSAVGEAMGSVFEPYLRIKRLTPAGLKPFEEQLIGFEGAVYIDDLTTGLSTYVRNGTLVTLADLCYSHRASSETFTTRYHITNFHGAVLACIQPVLLRDTIKAKDWEALLQDRLVRIYHLRRPLKITRTPPVIVPIGHTPMKDVVLGAKHSDAQKALMDSALVQWSMSRAEEHTQDLLRACASLDGRSVVGLEDYKLLLLLMRPLRTERWALRKRDFEEGRYLDSAMICMLTQFASYGTYEIESLMRDYKLSQSTAYRLLAEHADMWKIISKPPSVYAPSDNMLECLQDIGWLKGVSNA